MKSESVASLDLYYEDEEHEAARLIGTACEKSVDLLLQHWGLIVPANCRVYVMTSWQRFLFHSAPWPWKVYLALSFPLIARQAGTIWPYAGGWSLQLGRRRVVGVKPPRLIQAGNRSLGEQLFNPERDFNEKVQTVTCHELTHAFTFHLKLPTWLQEGLATLAMDYYLNRCNVRSETLERLDDFPARGQPGNQRLKVTRPQVMIDLYARGYWLTRYIDETRPDMMKEILSRRHTHKELVKKIATAYRKNVSSFWPDMMTEVKARNKKQRDQTDVEIYGHTK